MASGMPSLLSHAPCCACLTTQLRTDEAQCCLQVLTELTKEFPVLGATATNIITKSTNTTIKLHIDTNDGGYGTAPVCRT